MQVQLERINHKTAWQFSISLTPSFLSIYQEWRALPPGKITATYLCERREGRIKSIISKLS